MIAIELFSAHNPEFLFEYVIRKIAMKCYKVYEMNFIYVNYFLHSQSCLVIYSMKFCLVVLKKMNSSGRCKDLTTNPGANE